MSAELLSFPPPSRPSAMAALNQHVAAAVEAALRDERARCAELADLAAKARTLRVPFALADAIAGGMTPDDARGYVLEAASSGAVR